MRFIDPKMTAKFVGLARQKGYAGSIRQLGRKQVVTVNGFKNKTAERVFLSAWATVSCEVVEPEKGQLRFDNDPGFKAL